MKSKIDTQAAAKWLLENCVIVDTETTGLSNPQIMEIAIIDGDTGKQLQNSLVECCHDPEPEALALHGITSAMTYKDGIEVDDLSSQLSAIEEEGKILTSFNWRFDYKAIYYTTVGTDIPDPLPPWQYARAGAGFRQPVRPLVPICIMELANRHLHKHLEWDFEQSKFKRLSLARCCEISGVEFTGTAHRALPDAVAARDLLVAIAEGRV